MKKIIGIGNALIDILLQIPDDSILTTLNLKKGSMQLVDEQKMSEILEKLKKFSTKMVTGGSAANTINGISKLGGITGFLGKIGNDETGRFFENDIRENGVNAHLLRSKKPSGRCLSLISPDGERTMCTCLGAAADLQVADICPEIFNDYEIFYIEGYLVQNQELIRHAVALAAEMGLLVTIDMASFNIVEENLEFLHEIVEKYVNIVFANEEEAFAFTNDSPVEALNKIAEHVDISVVKIGEHGSFIKAGNSIFSILPVEAEAIDTTGAGDLYAAGFLYGLANHYQLDICGNIGSIVASKVVQTIGAKISDDVWMEIKCQILLWQSKQFAF
ncbi:MAG: adenosine kinase [Paludibacter sp.]|nr:adenosine kinase [Paludibacter sp.]